MAPTQSAPVPPTIPRFYRILFAYIDPILALTVFYQTYFTPRAFVTPYLPNPAHKLDSLHSLLLHQLGAAYLGSGVKSALIFVALNFWGRREEVSLGVWKALIAGFLVEDFGLIYSFMAGINGQGRMSLGGVRRDEWGLFGLVGTMMVLRGAFMMGVGLKTNKSVSRKQ